MTKEELTLIFGLAFIATSFVYAFLAAITTIFYRNKFIGDLGAVERDILYGRAGIGKRTGMFFLNLFGSVMAPPIYIIAGVVTLIAYLFTSYTFFDSVGIFIAIIISVVLGWKFLARQGTGHIKLHNLKFVDIQKVGSEYIYTYVVRAKLNFKNKYLKMVFTSQLPDYMWTEIQKAMAKNNIYFEDLVEGKPQDIKIGSITYSYFSDADFEKYGTDINKWQSALNKAVDKQTKLVEEENQKNPNRPKLYEIYDLWNE